MTRRRIEALLWGIALAAAILGWGRWRGGEADAPEVSPSAVERVPGTVTRVPEERLAAAARTVAGGNPFRLDRTPAPIAFGEPPAGVPGMPQGYTPPRPPRPPLAVSGIAGPPWRAVLEGVPGRDGGVIVQRGDEFGELRVREVTATTVVVAAPDTTWRLTLRRPWQ